MVDDPVPPVLPALTVIHGSLLVAVQAHSGVVVTATLPGPPEVPNVCDDGDSEYEQPCAKNSTAPELSSDSVVRVTGGTASLKVTLCPASRLKSVAEVDGR